MENVLIISSNKNAAEALRDFIKDAFHCNVRAVGTAFNAKSLIAADPSWELAVISEPLNDESGAELAEYIVQNTAASCVLIVKAEKAGQLADLADEAGIIILAKPINKTILYQLVRTIDIAIRRSWSLYEETVRLEKKLDEIQTIDKAKFRLMEFRGMTEEEAHNYLEQYAMNKRKKKIIAALEIIDKINEQYL